MPRATNDPLKDLEISQLQINELRDIWEKVFGWRPENTVKRGHLVCNLQFEQHIQKCQSVETDDRPERDPSYFVDI